MFNGATVQCTLWSILTGMPSYTLHQQHSSPWNVEREIVVEHQPLFLHPCNNFLAPTGWFYICSLLQAPLMRDQPLNAECCTLRHTLAHSHTLLHAPTHPYTLTIMHNPWWISWQANVLSCNSAAVCVPTVFPQTALGQMLVSCLTLRKYFHPAVSPFLQLRLCQFKSSRMAVRGLVCPAASPTTL